MSITLSATIAETRLGEGAGGIMSPPFLLPVMERCDPALHRKKTFYQQHQFVKLHIELGKKPQQFRLVCHVKTEVETCKQDKEISPGPIQSEGESS